MKFTYKGSDGREELRKFLAESEKEESEPEVDEEKEEPKEFNTDINKSDYIQIPNQNFLVAIAETNKNLNYEDAHRKTLGKGLVIPTPKQFMIFHNYVIDCYKNKKQIANASGNPIPEKIKDNLYKQLTEDCWTWLNGRFTISDTERKIEYITGIDSNTNQLITKSEDLEECLMKDILIDFNKLNNQGLPKLEAELSGQNFTRGENTYFWSPKNGRVARFDAGSDGTVLGCYGDPSCSYDILGVRAVKLAGDKK